MEIESENDSTYCQQAPACNYGYPNPCLLNPCLPATRTSR
jgi:hypothetical protein